MSVALLSAFSALGAKLSKAAWEVLSDQVRHVFSGAESKSEDLNSLNLGSIRKFTAAEAILWTSIGGVSFAAQVASVVSLEAPSTRFARAPDRAALWALHGADRPGWRPAAAAGGPRWVLVRVAASGGGGTAIGPGPRWRPPGPPKGCAVRSGT